MGSSSEGFRLVDCDGHVLEPLDIWDRYVEAKYRAQAKAACSVYNHPDGGCSALLNGELKPRVLQYGGTFGIPKHEQDAKRWLPEDLAKGGFDPHARVRDQMDPGKIEAAVVFGSLGNVLNGVRDANLLPFLCHAYNEWVSEEYCAPYPKRMYPMGYLPWQNVPESVKELKRIARKGFRGLKVPAKRRLVELPVYHEDIDPIWSEAEDAGLVLAVHPSVYWDDMPEMADVLVREPLSLPSAGGILTPMNGMVSLTHFIYGGVLERHPKLKLAIVECNGGWMPSLLDRLDRQYKVNPKNYPQLKLLPSEYFRRQCAVAFMAEESTLPVFADTYQDQIIWGSDFPHHDAESPEDICRALKDISPVVQQKILRNNAIDFFGLPLTKTASGKLGAAKFARIAKESGIQPQ